MTYIPSEYFNENYKYSYDNGTITVYKNCVDDNCSCNEVYSSLDYLSSNDFICSSSNIKEVDFSEFSDNLYYRVDLPDILLILTIFVLFIILVPLKILGRLFKRYDF